MKLTACFAIVLAVSLVEAYRTRSVLEDADAEEIVAPPPAIGKGFRYPLKTSKANGPRSIVARQRSAEDEVLPSTLTTTSIKSTPEERSVLEDNVEEEVVGPPRTVGKGYVIKSRVKGPSRHTRQVGYAGYKPENGIYAVYYPNYNPSQLYAENSPNFQGAVPAQYGPIQRPLVYDQNRFSVGDQLVAGPNGVVPNRFEDAGLIQSPVVSDLDNRFPIVDDSEIPPQSPGKLVIGPD